MSDYLETVETAVSPDGSKRWRLLRRRDGFYTYEEETYEKAVYWVEEDGSEKDVAAPAYWKPTLFSGLFDSDEGARMDALGTLHWLRDITQMNGN